MTARLLPRRFFVGAATTCAAVAVAIAASPAATAVAAHPAASAPAWQIVKTLRRQDGLAIASVSRTSAWVFANPEAGNPTARLLTGDTLKQYPLPALADEGIGSPAASGPDNVWAVGEHWVYAWNGSAWQVVRKFGQSDFLFSVLPVGPANVLLFTSQGTWHYGPSGWVRERTGYGLTSASGLAPASVWAVDRDRPDVAHWNGSTWRRTSLAALLPPSPYLCHYGLTGVLAVSATNVWVTASGNCQDSGGPLLLLHYNGNHWARAPLAGSYGTANAVAGDGSRALWLDVSGGAGGSSSLYEYSAGQMRLVQLPVPHAGAFEIDGLAAGWALVTDFRVPFADATAYLLRYGR